MSSIPRGDSDRQSPNEPTYTLGQPNTFAVFTAHIDDALRYLTDAEFRVLLYFSRHATTRPFPVTGITLVYGFSDNSGQKYPGCGIKDLGEAVSALNSLLDLGIIHEDFSFGEPSEWLDALKARAAKGGVK